MWEKSALAKDLSCTSSTFRRYQCRAKHQIGSIVPTQGQKHHHSLISPGEYNGHDEEECASPPQSNIKELQTSYDDEFIFSELNYSSLFLNSEDEFDDDLLDTSSIACDPKSSGKMLEPFLLANRAQEEDGRKRKFAVHCSDTPAKFTDASDVSDLATQQQLRYQENRILELESELSKLRKTVAKLKNNKFQLQENIASYYSQSSDRGGKVPTMQTNPRAQQTKSGSKQQGLECVNAAQSLVSCLGGVDTGSRSDKVITKLAGEIVDII
ncbi:hypothetical protein ACA910_020813 [Epithemia clementina (nom. ined.)]